MILWGFLERLEVMQKNVTQINAAIDFKEIYTTKENSEPYPTSVTLSGLR